MHFTFLPYHNPPCMVQSFSLFLS
uniref:Uncharacterized protein n=1 Tax=Anguilla anguilla TaxID=7936 RepID=A0A0E9UX74_ANGAN